MVCVDQNTAEKNEEPFVTLSKTRRVDGRVLFGMHAAHIPRNGTAAPMIMVGDVVKAWGRDNEDPDTATDEESDEEVHVHKSASRTKVNSRRMKRMLRALVSLVKPYSVR